MTDNFKYDVFISYSSKDKTVAHAVAMRLQADGLRVWFEGWTFMFLDSEATKAAKIEEALEHSRVLVLCISAQAVDSDWAQLESGTFRFRDPLNKERRFIPLRLDGTPLRGPLAQFPSIDWLPNDRDPGYAKLFDACRLQSTAKPTEASAATEHSPEEIIQLDYDSPIRVLAFNSDGMRALTGHFDGTMRLWEVGTGSCLRVFEGHTKGVPSFGILDPGVLSVEWGIDERRALSLASDKSIRVWDVESGRSLQVFKSSKEGAGLYNSIERFWCFVSSSDHRRALTGSRDSEVRIWDIETGQCLNQLSGHATDVKCVAWSQDQCYALSGSEDRTIRLWDVKSGSCRMILEGHTAGIRSVAWSADQLRVLSSSDDKTLRLWEVKTGRCLLALQGHGDRVITASWSPDQRRALSGSLDSTVRVWDVETGQCLRVLIGHTNAVRRLAWSSDGRTAFSSDDSGSIRVWNLFELATETKTDRISPTPVRTIPAQVQYTNAKVLLVGESGAGKTGLSRRLALDDWQASDSTVGAWATQWKLPVSPYNGIEREIWLWDFGGQADQRLIHQLYMEETALAVLVFDGQKEDLFETLGQWDRDLTRASHNAFSKLLVAGRIDAGGLRVSRSQVEAFAKERGYIKFLETSAKANLHCEDLRNAILDGIRWEGVPWRSSPLLFKRLKEEIVRLKDDGQVLVRFNDLREALQLRLSSEDARFTDEELKAVLGLLAAPGVVWELKFGSWVLLQPERINAYAQAVIQTMREDGHERGCLPEERVFTGDLTYHSSMARLEADEERFVLLAMHQMLVERGLCLREHTDQGPLLIFPSYYRRERPELVGHPAVLVSYRFNGFLDDIYATLVVRLHHTESFEADELWRYAADFKSLSQERRLGVKLTRRSEGAGELEVYFDPDIPVAEKMIFSRYVHEHLLKKGNEVVRLRHYVCPHCKTPVRDRETAMWRLTDRGKEASILCVKCEKRVPLWDELEDRFAAPEIHQRVLELDKRSQIVLDNADKERTLVGEVISTVSLAGQICRELTVSDNGIDMEIEFKSDSGEATARKLYLQLKSGDSYLRERKRDGAEIFKIKDERHARYWMAQAFPVLLVIRNSEGEVRWMEVRDWLRRESNNGKKPVRQIVFEGERFDVMSVRRWRERA